MNTHFQKKTIHKYTLQNPGSNKQHCIDYVIMCQKQRRLCSDVGVVYSAECWTDHMLLCTKIQLMIPHRIAARKTRAKHAVSALTDSRVKDAYSKRVMEEVSREWIG